MKCKNCKNRVKRTDDDGTLYDFCGMVIDSPDTERERNCKYYIIATNADRIRAMTDEELAELLEGCVCPKTPCQDIDRDTPTDKKRCTECWLDWLKQECE